jgi:hypothetical protein
MVQAISKKSWLAVNRETTPGTAVLTTPHYYPTKSTMKGTKKTEYIDDERGTRDGNYDYVETTREGSNDIKGAYYNDSSPYLLLGVFGAVTSTQPDSTNAPTVYKHDFSLTDQPPTFTFIKSYHSKVYYMANSAVEKVTLKFSSDGKLLECDGSVKGLFPQEYTGATLTPTFSAVKPFAGFQPTISLNSLQTKDISEFQIEISQKLTMWYAIDGLQDFDAIYFGERTAKCDFTARFDNDTLYQRFLTGQTDSIVVDIQGPTIVNTYKQEFNIQIPVLHYDSMEHDLGKDNVLIKAKGTAITTSSGLIHAFVQNTVQSY